MRASFGRGRVRRLGGILAGAVATCLTLAASASATFHLMSVSEVFPGSTAAPAQDFVELQMYSSGQNFVNTHKITVYAANGTVADTFTFPASVSNGENQRTILVGAAGTVAGVIPDQVDAGLASMDPNGGAVCWETLDCVSWGTFAGTGLVPSAGTPASAISDGSSLTRSITPACATMLDAADDTNDSATDFSLATPSPRNNAGTITETPCPNTAITAGPSGKTTDRTPTFKFKSIPAGAGFECRVDANAFVSCTSPDTLPKLMPGSHTFKVRALNGPSIDPTPASQRFKVVRKR